MGSFHPCGWGPWKRCSFGCGHALLDDPRHCRRRAPPDGRQTFSHSSGSSGICVAQCTVAWGGDPDRDPWMADDSGDVLMVQGMLSASGASGSKENLLKMSNIVDQTDDSETRLPDALKLNE